MPISSTQLSFFVYFVFLIFGCAVNALKYSLPSSTAKFTGSASIKPLSSRHIQALDFIVRSSNAVTMDYVRNSLSFIIKVLFTLRLDLFLLFTYCTIFLYFISPPFALVLFTNSSAHTRSLGGVINTKLFDNI